MSQPDCATICHVSRVEIKTIPKAGCAAHGIQALTSSTHVQFITNIFFIPFLALRETMPAQPQTAGQQSDLPDVSPWAGWVALAVGVFSIGWAAVARPEYGGIAERLQYFSASFTGDRQDCAATPGRSTRWCNCLQST